jgi:hypothetical protein
VIFCVVNFHTILIVATCGACLEEVVEFEQKATYSSSIEGQTYLSTFGMPE